MDLGPERKRKISYLVAFFVALWLGLVSSFFYEKSAYDGRVLRGIEWSERTLSGLDRVSLQSLLSTQDVKVRDLSIEFVLSGEAQKLRAGEVGISLDTARVLRQAFSAGHEGSVFRQFGFWFARLFMVHRIPVVIVIDEGKLKKVFEPWAKVRLEEPELPSLSFDRELVVVEGRGGSVVEYPHLQTALNEAVLQPFQGAAMRNAVSRLEVPTTVRPAAISRQTVEATVARARVLLSEPVTVSSEEGNARSVLSPAALGAALSSKVDEGNATFQLDLSIETLRDALKDLLQKCERKAVEAEFEFPAGGASVISASQTGRLLDEDALKQALLQLQEGGPRQITLPLRVEEPALSTLEAEKLRIKGLVMSFTTRHPCCQPRVLNIHHAAARLDGHVLRPGEKFSLNEFLGPRALASGYQKAPTIVRGEMEDVYGGGISQLATTLFNAVLRGGYEIIQRQPHSVYFPRYPEGHEATVSYPEPDLIFRNDTEAGMVIKTNAAPTFISVLIYGDNGGRVTTVDKGQRYNIVAPPKEYEPDDGMAPEKVKRLRAGQLGWTVLVSRKVKYPDGTEKFEKREVVYNPRPELLRVHPCMIPEGEEGHTGDECPEIEIEEEEEELSEDAYFETD